jgi:hypothetical protein
MFQAGIRSTISTIHTGLRGLGQRAYSIAGNVKLSDIEEHMQQHVANACERTEALVGGITFSFYLFSYT